MIYAFDAYTLDTEQYELRHAGRLCRLEPQALDILAYLLEHRDRVVTKHELLEHLWPKRFVGEGILAQRLMTIRKAIGDSGRSQCCIKTLHGRGYRFAASVTVYTNAADFANAAAAAGPANESGLVDDAVPERSGPGAASRAQPHLFSRPAHFVGRDTELTQLAQWWSTVQGGVRQIGFIGGEPGIGKTALVDTFVAQVVATGGSSVGCGQCVDDYGAGEPYLPLLEALGRLCRSAEGARFATALRRYAPTWLAHLPAALTAPGSDSLVRTMQGMSPAQMLRELTDALEALTQTRPLVLVLEDLHWSDRATLAWLAYVARRRDPARLLILATYRPGDLGHAHPLRSVLTEVHSHPQCVKLVLTALSAPEVDAYLHQRSVVTLPASAPEIIHYRSGGYPLFLVAIVDELLREKLFEMRGEAGGSGPKPATLGEIIPTNLQQYIEQHLQRLSDDDQTLLEAASTAGSTFTVAAAAAGVAQAPKMIEARYAALARQGRFIRASGTEAWPDGTMTACYQFKHALYHDVVYARVSVEQRVHLHQEIGARKEAGYGARAPEIAAELAVHFARGRDATRAVHYLHHAAENALRRSAYDTAITHVRQGLHLLGSLPDTADRTQRELSFLTTLGLALVATKGQAHGEVESTFVRARELCHRLGDSRQQCTVLGGLFSFYVVRSQLQAACDVAEQLRALAERQPDTSLRLVAHWALGETLLFQGELVPARAQLEHGIALYKPQEHYALSVHAGFPGDLGVFCHCFTAHTLWHLGYPDRALRHIHEALSLAEVLAHPFSRALALAYAAMLYQFRRDQRLTQEAAEAAITLCQEQGFSYYLAWVTTMKGWALNAQGPSEEGMAQMCRGLAAIRATGAALRQPYYLALLAEAHGQASQVESGLTLLAEALSEVHRHGEYWHEAELHRLRGVLLLRAGVHATCSHADGDAPSIDTEAEQCFHQALMTARRQHAKSLELRAAVNLARLWQQKGNHAKARDLLTPLYAWFTEGFRTADLRDAKALLDEIG